MHPDTALAHRAASEAQAQGKFWEYAEALFSDIHALERPHLEARAAALGIDLVRLRAGLDTPVHQAHVDRDMADADRLNIEATPTHFINGRRLLGDRSLQVFRTIIDEELAAAAVPAASPAR